MEELLNKNIFDSKDLEKLSPDYTPPNMLLRMVMRSTTVKDTHSHKFKSENRQRKTIKRSKDINKVNKEIAKIRNGFQSINLKNQIMLKNAVKFVNTLKSEDFVNYSDEEFTLEDKTKTYLQEIAGKNENLVVQNDSDFKINDKPRGTKLSIEYRKTKKILKNNPTQIDTNKFEKDIFDAQDLLRIECKLLKQEINNHETVKIETNDIVDTKESNYSLDLSTPQKVIEKDVNDLEELMIMMAISRPCIENVDEITNGQASINLDQEINTAESNSKSIIPMKDTMNMPKSIIEFLNITPLRVEINNKQKQMLKKYVKKWRTYVIKRKEYVLSQQREETLNSFFDKLAKKKMDVSKSPEPVNKAKMIARDFSRYRSRYLMQKHIIALQKAKLEEQNRIIEELKFNRIVDASRQSIDAMREEVCRTYYDMDRQLKPKIKCLTNDLKIEIEEPSLVLHCLKVPQFLQRMEKRAREREEKHALIRERRKQMEEERIRRKQQEEIAKAQMDKEEKIKRMKELKDKRKREKIEGIRKKQHVERMRALTVMAELHYEKVLMAKYGIRPFKILMEIKRDNIEKAMAHYKFQLKKNVFLNWMWYTEDMWYERNFKAESFFRKKLLKKAFDGFKQYHHTYVLKKQVAEDYYDLYVTNLVFKKFREAVEIVKSENEKKWQKAVTFYNCDLLFKVFTCWRTLPALNVLKREQEARKARWREKVLQVVPDYTPPDD